MADCATGATSVDLCSSIPLQHPIIIARAPAAIGWLGSERVSDEYLDATVGIRTKYHSAIQENALGSRMSSRSRSHTSSADRQSGIASPRPASEIAKPFKTIPRARVCPNPKSSIGSSGSKNWEQHEFSADTDAAPCRLVLRSRAVAGEEMILATVSAGDAPPAMRQSGFERTHDEPL